MSCFVQNVSDMKKTTPPFFLFTALLYTCVLLAQQKPDAGLEKLRQDLSVAKSTKKKVDALNAIGNHLTNSSYDSAVVYYKKALALSKLKNYTEGIYQYTSNMGNILLFQAKYDEMEEMERKGIVFAKANKDKHWEAIFTTNIGCTYMYKAEYEKAIAILQSGLKLFKENKEPRYVRKVYGFIAICFLNSYNIDKAIEYGRIYSRLAKTAGDEEGHCDALSVLGKGFIEKDQFQSAKPYIDSLYALAVKNNFGRQIADSQFDKSRILYSEKKYAAAIQLCQTAIAYYEQTGNLFDKVSAMSYLAKYYDGSGNTSEATKIIETTLKLAKENKMSSHLLLVYEVAAKVYSKSGDHKNAFAYLQLQQKLNDSINSADLKSKLQESDAKYQNAEKEKQILLLETAQSKNRIFLFTLVGLMAVLLIIGYLVYRNFIAKKKISEQQILQLQQEKKMVAAENMLEGEKTERTRLARDLHDGLGGMLSGVKFQLNSMKGNVILSEENAVTFTKSISQLDNAIAEMRRVAHNMMPEALLKFGLVSALEDYCLTVDENSQLAVSFQSYGLEQRLEQTVEIVLFRIVQELLNNTIKHAQASQSHVQLSRNGHVVSLTVEDNGKGMNVSEQTNGIGLSNIRNRVDYLNGKMDIQSDSAGTSINIEFEIPST